MGCLGPGKGSDVLEECLTKYACKGGEDSASHETNANALTEHYCKNDDNSEKGFCNLMGNHMTFVSGSMSVSQDQDLYLLGGGQLKRSTEGAPIKCSLTAIGLDELVPSNPDENGGNSKSFTWKKIVTATRKGAPNSIYWICTNTALFIGRKAEPPFLNYLATTTGQPGRCLKTFLCGHLPCLNHGRLSAQMSSVTKKITHWS